VGLHGYSSQAGFRDRAIDPTSSLPRRRWTPEHWGPIRRIADYTAKHWRKPRNGIWERDQQRHFVSSKLAVYAMMGRRNDAETMLRRIEALEGRLGLFSEKTNGRSMLLLGNFPMIFSHAKYVRAVLQLHDLWPCGI
jgi:GH15 family glucan-1,4-alpha-glucosidase